MSVVALSPVATEPPSHMITSVTPTTNHGPLPSGSVKEQLQDQALSPGHSSEPYPSWSPLPGGQGGPQPPCRHRRAPPLHTGADWKVVLHLPEIETWLRATAERVTQLTHSVSQDTHHRHVDVHLVQLKDICEDISDHVEQIHALLETEFSLKLLSYSVNIIVDIRTVQVLWHQLRVSVLVLKERLLQGLQDSNGNFTRKTDILQAFSQEQQQTRLDALTEVDDCGQLTIRCSQDYFSLDCGITAYELSDYSPGEPPETQEEDPDLQDPQIPDPNLKEIQDPSSQYLQEPNIQDPQLPQDPEEPQREEIQRRSEPKQPVKKGAEQRDPEAAHTDSSNSADSLPPAPTMHRGASNPCEALMSKRPLPVGGVGGALSPTQPSLPKRVALLADGRAGVARTGRALGKPSPPPRYRFQVEMSPSPVDPVERSKFWLELDSQSTENLQVVNGCDRQTTAQSLEVDGEAEWGTRGPHTPQSGSSWVRHSLSGGKSDSPLPSPRGEAFLTSFDMETSREDLDGPATPAELLVKGPRQQTKVHWFGSEEFLALPDHLRQTELLAINLESLAQTLPLMSSGCELNQEGLQDIDDWDLTELNPEWDMGESSDDTPPAGESSDDAPFMEHQQQSRHYRFRVSPSSSSDIAPSSSSDIAPSSSSDIAPSLDESIESGPLSDLRLEADEGRSTRTTDSSLEAQSTSPLLDAWGTTSLVSQLLEGIQRQESNPNIWKKIEGFVLRLDVFIAWLKDALLSTDNWTQPKQELDSLRLYLDTHLSFKMNVDSRSVLKESIMEEGRLLLTLLTSHNSGLRDILQMVSGQWDQLQRQIRRQHSWMLEALRTLLRQSHGPLLAFQGTVSNQQRPCPTDCPKVELTDRQQTQREALEQMAASLSNLYYTTTSTRRRHSQPARSTSLQEFEANYQELWDWLMDMEAMVTDSHQLMMSEVQKDHLYKGLQGDVSQMRIRMSSLLGLTESLKRSPVRLPQDFQHKMHTLTQRWKLLEKMISEHSGVSTSHPPQGHQSGLASLEPLGFMGGDSGRAAEPSSLCPLSRTLLDQLEVRIKELKSWLRDTELLIFHSCLRTDQSASVQLPSFKSLCEEVRGRRRAVSSVLRLCQKLLQQSQMGPLAELGPDAEQHREALQLLSINLERRWEAIVMQSLQWQNRLKKELEEEQVLGNDLELDLADLNQTSLVPPALVGPEDSWEWDEMDMTITGAELQDITGHNILTTAHPDMFQSDGTQSGSMAPHGLESYENLPIGTCSASSDLTFQSERPIAMPLATPPNNNRIYQVYSLHNIELSGQHLWSLPHRSQTLSPSKTNTGNRKHQPPLKSHSKDSSFSSYESLPDLLGGGPLSVGGGERGESTVGYMDGGRGGRGSGGRSSGGRSSGGRSSGGRTSGGRSSGSGESESSRHSESESGIASDTETTANSEIQGDNDEDEEEERRTLRIGEKEGGTWDGQEAEEASADAAGRTGTHTSQGRREVGVVGGRGREESKSESRKRSDCREGQSKWKRTERAGEGRRLRDKMNVEKRRGQRKSEEEEAKMSAGRACLLVPPPPGSNLEAMETTQEPTKPFSRQDDVTGLKAFHAGGLEALLGPAGLSRGSSLESLLALGLELFPSPKDPLQRSASLESCLASCLSGGGTSSVSLASLGESGPTEAGVPGNDPGMSQGDVSSGELSRRTLDLLKRLEKIQSPPAVKMTRSVSDMVMHSSPQFRGLRTSPLLWGPHALLPGAMVTGGSATTSLTELSGAEDSSLGSEDCNALKSRLFLDPGAPDNGNFCSFRRRCHGNGRRGQGGEEADAASLSMVVNVSCTSEDEDDSDLLSSSTLTLTEEELGVREEEEETSSIASSGDEEAEIEEEEMEGCEYIRKELHNWNRPPRLSFSSSRGEASLQDELQCGSSASSASSASSNPHNSCTLSSSPLPGSLVAHNAAESGITNGNNKARSEQEEKEQKEEDLENRRNATRSYIRRLVDDVENGNVEHSRLTGREEDDQLLLEEAGLFMKKAEAFRFQSCIFATTGDGLSNAGHMTGDCESSITKTDPLSSPTCELLRFSSKQTSSLVGQLRGELPCQSPPRPSPPSLSPTDDSMSHDALQSNVPAARGRKSITIQESFAFSSLVTEESRRQVRDKESSFAPKRRRHVLPSCCLAHLPPRRPSSSPEQKRENVHDFVMEIIDMTSHALRGKGNQTQTQDQDQTQDQVQGQLYEGTTDPITASLAHIREKVLEHSHQPLQLRKGDFYSYLSLSSHDSDCGEVSLFSEEKSSTPAPYSIPCYATPMPSLRGPSPAPPASPAPATHAHTQNSLLIRPEKATSACDPATDGGRSGQPSNSLHRAHQASSSSPSPDIRDEETLFSACTEEVYLGPPLCYSMEFTQETRGSSVELTEETRGSSVELTQETRGSSPRLSQGPGYLSSQGPRSRLLHAVPRASPPQTCSVVKEDPARLPQGGSGPQSSEARGHLSPPKECIPRRLQCGGGALCEVGESLHGVSPSPGNHSKTPPSSVRSSSGRRPPSSSGELGLLPMAPVPGGSRGESWGESSGNEEAAYLNPSPRVTAIGRSSAHCTTDSEALESNMGAVMTKISVCSSTTNPSEEAAVSGTRINPQMKCSMMREGDTEGEERGGRLQSGRGREEDWMGRTGSQQEAKETAGNQIIKSTHSGVSHVTRTSQSTSSSMTVKTPPGGGVRGQRSRSRGGLSSAALQPADVMPHLDPALTQTPRRDHVHTPGAPCSIAAVVVFPPIEPGPGEGVGSGLCCRAASF